MFLRGDFHIHTNTSDGTLSPLEVILLAKNKGMDVIAITDHNSVNAINRAVDAGKSYGISVIPGVELSTRINGECIHLLGYFKTNQFNDGFFQRTLELVRSHKAQEVRRLLGFYKSKGSLSNYLTVREGINLLKNFEAAVVLAHPMLISRKNLTKVLSMPFDGIEAKYCGRSEQETSLLIKEALTKYKFYTGGSDFHTDKVNANKHCIIGYPSLNAIEIQRFLGASGVLVLGPQHG